MLCGFGHKVKFVGHKMRICAHDLIRTERQQKRNPMISVGFARVRKKRPCRICGKPTYCGFSRDEGTSICMRISAGSRGLSRNGGNIHVHPEIPFITIRPKIKNANSQSISLAPLEDEGFISYLLCLTEANGYDTPSLILSLSGID